VQLATLPGMDVLVASKRGAVRRLVEKSFSDRRIKWEDDIRPFVNELAASIAAFGDSVRHSHAARRCAVSQCRAASRRLSHRTGASTRRFTSAAVGAAVAQVRVLQEKRTVVENALTSMRTCAYEAKEFSAAIATIQGVIDDLNLADFTNLEVWVRDLDGQVRYSLSTVDSPHSHLRSECVVEYHWH
jgi:hypothetical protein